MKTFAVLTLCALTVAVTTGCPQEIRGDPDAGLDGSVGPTDGSTGTSDGGPDGGDVCKPLTCADVEGACGMVSDGCSGMLDCGCGFALACGPVGASTTSTCHCAQPGFVARVADTGAGYTGLFSSMVIDPEGTLHAAYVDGDDGFKYLRASTRTDAWAPTIEPVEQGVPITGTSLAVDAAGVVHVGYYRWSAVSSNIWDAEFWYARRDTDGKWTKSRVVSAGEMVYAQADDAAIALDANGTIHLLYYVFTYNHADLWHAYSPNGTGWVTELAVPGSDIGSNWSSAGSVSLASDAEGTLHALYFDYATRQLKLARRPQNGTWTVRAQPLATPAQSTDWAGASSSMAFDASGRLHVAYSMEVTGGSSLWHGTLDSSDAFSAAQVDPATGTSGAGIYNALAIDSVGRVRIAHYDSAAKDLRYSFQTAAGAGFVSETAQSQGSVGSHAALAIDADGTSHVLYFELLSQSTMTGQLRYASRCH